MTLSCDERYLRRRDGYAQQGHALRHGRVRVGIDLPDRAARPVERVARFGPTRG